MKGTYKMILVLAVAAAIVGAMAPAALAQCPAARFFGAAGPGPKITIDTVANPGGVALADANELFQFWEVGTPGNLVSTATGTCPSAQWWLQGGPVPPPFRFVSGNIATPTCQMPLCPANNASLIWVIEEETGTGNDAGFIAYMVDETPPSSRWWDHGRTGGGGANTFQAFQLFPKVNVTGTSGTAPNITTTSDYDDPAAGYNGVRGGGGLVASNGIAAYDVVGFVGGADPGRARSAWTSGIVKSIPYLDASISGDMIDIALEGLCDAMDLVGKDTYLAVGVTFVDGIQSQLVGAPTIVECQPNLADPQPRLQRRQQLGRGTTGRTGR